MPKQPLGDQFDDLIFRSCRWSVCRRRLARHCRPAVLGYGRAASGTSFCRQAAISGKAAAGQALGVGTALSGIYMASRIVGAVRKMWHKKQEKSKKRRAWWKFGKK